MNCFELSPVWRTLCLIILPDEEGVFIFHNIRVHCFFQIIYENLLYQAVPKWTLYQTRPRFIYLSETVIKHFLLKQKRNLIIKSDNRWLSVRLVHCKHLSPRFDWLDTIAWDWKTVEYFKVIESQVLAFGKNIFEANCTAESSLRNDVLFFKWSFASKKVFYRLVEKDKKSWCRLDIGLQIPSLKDFVVADLFYELS